MCQQGAISLRPNASAARLKDSSASSFEALWIVSPGSSLPAETLAWVGVVETRGGCEALDDQQDDVSRMLTVPGASRLPKDGPSLANYTTVSEIQRFRAVFDGWHQGVAMVLR